MNEHEYSDDGYLNDSGELVNVDTDFWKMDGFCMNYVIASSINIKTTAVL